MKRFILLFLLLFTITGCSISFGHKEYYCSNGELYGEKCMVSSSEPVITYCEKGELKDGKCHIASLTIDAKKGSEKVCSPGYSLYYMNKSDMCVSDATFSKDAKLTCPEPAEGTEMNEIDGKCIQSVCKAFDDEGKCINLKTKERPYDIEYTCPKGTRLIYGACRKYSYRKLQYSCEIGELKDDKCIIYDDVSPKVKCPDGYTLNSKDNVCEKKYYVEANVK